jgi:hypothetical protein
MQNLNSTPQKTRQRGAADHIHGPPPSSRVHNRVRQRKQAKARNSRRA